MLQLATFSRADRWAVRLLWAAGAIGLAVFAIAAGGGPGDPTSTPYKCLFVMLVAVPGGLCLMRARLVAEQRGTWALFGVAILFWGAGELVYFAVLEGQRNPPSPSITDDLWLVYYGVSFLAVFALIRSGLTHVRKNLWIDALVGGLAVAAIGAALLLEPILDSTGGSVAAVATNLTFPLMDALMIGLLIGVFAISNGRPGRVWTLLSVVWVLQAIVDTVYLYQAAAGDYAFGTLLDATWPALMLVVALAAWHEPTVRRSSRDQGWGMLGVTIGFAVVGLSLTTYDHWYEINDVALILATLTLLVAFVRTTATFGEIRAHASGVALAKQQQLILDAAGDGIVGMNADGLVTFANPAASRMTGYTPEELAGRDLHTMVHHTRAGGDPYPVEECPIHASLLDGTIHHCDADVYWRKDGSSFAVEYTSTPIVEAAGIGGVVVVFRDVHERREVERVKDEFTSVVSHELRTPLTSIRGSLGLLESGVVGPLTDRAQRMIQIAVQNTDRLVRLINDILDLERLDSDTLHLRESPCDAAQLIARATDAMLPAAVAADVTLTVDAAPTIFQADEDRLIQTLANLISNAVKFTPAGGTVQITTERHSDEILFSVRDSGRGIAPDKLESIFERFQQIDSSDSRQTGGTGLGLAICRSIVEHHGGRIWASSLAGEGSTFSFVVPAALDAADAYTPRPGGDRGAVLMCDDNAEILEVTGTALEAHGYRVILARTGEQMIERALAEHPDVILLDLIMPDMSGVETLVALRQHAAADDIPVVVLSVLPRSDEEMAHSAFADWIQKPAAHADLFTALDRAIAPRDDTFRVLFVERDPAVGEVLDALLHRHGVASFAAVDMREAVTLCKRIRPDLILLDDDRPAADGLEIGAWLRLQGGDGALSIVAFNGGGVVAAERERRSVGAVSQILSKGQVSDEDFRRHVMTLLALPRTPSQSPEANHAPAAHPARR
jgi:PAS domain S-box-containing protein